MLSKVWDEISYPYFTPFMFMNEHFISSHTLYWIYYMPDRENAVNNYR